MQLRKGQLVAVTFLDHVEDGSEPMTFIVYGELSEVSKAHICVDCWCYYDPAVPHDANEKRYTILRSTILHVSQLARR